MRGLKWNAGLLTVSLFAGCAAAPRQSTEVSSVAEPVPAVAAASSAEVVPDKVIDLNAVIDDSPSRVVCKEMLKEMSNVVVKRCMTVADWEKYKRAQALRAEEFVRQLQGFR
jgi:hypothetical protein